MSTREPGASLGPLLSIVRSATRCAWAVRAGLPEALAGELDRLAGAEPPTLDLRDPPVHADRYLSLVGDQVGSGPEARLKARQSDGPAFTFPEALVRPPDAVVVEEERLLERNFRGWVPGEIAAAGRRCSRSSRRVIRSVCASAPGGLMPRRKRVLRPRRGFVVVDLVPA
jgi:hypothetical protein